MPEAERVTVGKGDPADNFTQIGPVTGLNGSGCGAFGRMGTYEGAVTNIRNKAAQMGADYVQIMVIKEPHQTYNCYVNTYQINGTAYKKTKESPSPVPIAISDTNKDKRTLTEKLRELNQLKSEGLLSDQEYEEQRRRVLKE